ncbi:hypothetical protein [Nocardiopsis chromatogenes]|uniref:hypothetical protein n=1 Tax=Nocardiopsis chromatogenes TaxID=280239 RepID=UPI00034C4A16|nr:hypothetical protein [Nocardiopsis chromatogenes]
MSPLTAFAILAVMAAGVGLMLTRRLPTAFALILMSVAIALLAGAPLVGEEDSVTATVLQEGAPMPASTMVAILLGCWLGTLMPEAGIASTLVRKIVEFGGDRPSVVAVGVFAVAILCGSITGSAPAAMLACVVGIPAMIAVGMLLAAVNLPGAVRALNPVVTAISPSGPLLFVAVFAVLVPLCLYRGPMNIFGLGAGVEGVLISGGIYPPPAVLGLMASYGQVLGVSDPTSTQTVWSAQYAGVRPERSMLSTIPYTWIVAIAGLVLTAWLYRGQM